MKETLVNQNVQLKRDIPELGLSRGDVGLVCSTWFSPAPVYEVEFQVSGMAHKTRTLLMRTQLSPAAAET
jgi:hypothetical protein